MTGRGLHSAIYEGRIRHRRFTPIEHQFSYRMFMLYVDLEELPHLFDGVPGWSVNRWSLMRFRRNDFLGDPTKPLKACVLDTVEQALAMRPSGPVRMLTNFRYFGVCFNPVTFYYCFDAQDALQAIVAEVNNTPWNERHCYVIDCRGRSTKQNLHFDKQFHVSPFNPLAMRYQWRSCKPDQRLVVHMENYRDELKHMDATLVLSRKPWRALSLVNLIWRFPMMTVVVVFAIYWQALRLYVKGARVYNHSRNSSVQGIPEKLQL